MIKHVFFTEEANFHKKEMEFSEKSSQTDPYLSYVRWPCFISNKFIMINAENYLFSKMTLKEPTHTVDKSIRNQ